MDHFRLKEKTCTVDIAGAILFSEGHLGLKRVGFSLIKIVSIIRRTYNMSLLPQEAQVPCWVKAGQMFY